MVGVTDETTTQAICAFVVLRANYDSHEGTTDELRAEVAREISPIAKPREVHVVPELPKTPQRQNYAQATSRCRRKPRTG